MELRYACVPQTIHALGSPVRFVQYERRLRVFAGKQLCCQVATARAFFTPGGFSPFLGTDRQTELDLISWLPSRGSGHADRKNDRETGVSRSGCVLPFCI